jgi:hypothetical protein
MGEVLGVPIEHLSGDPNPSAGAPRPRNCELDISRTEALGVGRQTPLREGLGECLGGAGLLRPK